MNDLTVVIPVHNEDVNIVTKIYCQLSLLGCEVIIVDDGATMEFDDAIRYINYQPHMGYGYAIKQGIRHATKPIILTLDGDGQHGIDDVEKLYKVYKMVTNCKMVIGCRFNLKEKPLRWFGRKCLNFMASVLAGHYLIDLNSGMRIFSKDLALGYEPILCDTFSFTTSITMAFVTDGHKIAWLPIDVMPRASGKSHVKVIKDGFITLFYIIQNGIALRTRRLRRWLRGR